MRKELFYTEGTAALKQARLQIAHFSLDRAATRLAGAKRKRESPDEDEEAEQKDTIALMSTVGSRICLMPVTGIGWSRQMLRLYMGDVIGCGSYLQANGLRFHIYVSQIGVVMVRRTQLLGFRCCCEYRRT